MRDESQALDEISRAAFALLLKEPFYAHVLAGMPREASDRVMTTGTAWDGQQVRLRVNPKFFLGELTASQRTGVLKHEILHVAFRHVFRGADRDSRVFSVAADLVVNQLVKPYPLPDGYPTLADFPDLGLPPDKNVDDYYGALMKLLREMRQTGFDGDEPSSEWSGGTSTPESAAALAKILIHKNSRGDDGGWHDGNDGVSAAGRYAVGNLILRARERMPPHQSAGLPATLVSEIQVILSERQPKVDWKRIIRIFCASSGRTRIRHTIKRVSKRYGTRPGIKVQRHQRLAIVIDTSGSITQRDVEEFFIEVHAIWKTGASVTVIECDAAVHRTYEYRGKTPNSVKGGGANDCDPAFQWIRQHGPFDGCLFITDGYVPEPQVRPNCKLLWVIAEDGSTDELPYGPTVRMPASKE